MSELYAITTTTTYQAPTEGWPAVDASRGTQALAGWKMHPEMVSITTMTTHTGTVTVEQKVLLYGNLHKADEGRVRQCQTIAFQRGDEALPEFVRELCEDAKAAGEAYYALRVAS